MDTITSYLFYRGGDDEPVRLSANRRIAFEGSKVYGQGFIFDDHDPGSTPLAEMRRLVVENPANGERIFPYISGEEVNSRPVPVTDRYVIDFRNMTLEEAGCWPDLLAIVEEKVKPYRLLQKRQARRDRWWIHGEHRPGLYQALEPLKQVLVNSKVSQWLTLVLIPTGFVYSHNLNVFALDDFGSFCTLQSRVHEIWVRHTSSTLEDRLGYRPTDCFETFPFPEGWQSRSALEDKGRTYYEFRAEVMIRKDQGSTQTYNRFHNPDENDPDIVRLRQLHSIMDRAVLDAYGWGDIPTDCGFLLDYEIDEEGGRRKKPYRYRWPDDVRDGRRRLASSS